MGSPRHQRCRRPLRGRRSRPIRRTGLRGRFRSGSVLQSRCRRPLRRPPGAAAPAPAAAGPWLRHGPDRHPGGGGARGPRLRRPARRLPAATEPLRRTPRPLPSDLPSDLASDLPSRGLGGRRGRALFRRDLRVTQQSGETPGFTRTEDQVLRRLLHGAPSSCVCIVTSGVRPTNVRDFLPRARSVSSSCSAAANPPTEGPRKPPPKKSWRPLFSQNEEIRCRGRGPCRSTPSFLTREGARRLPVNDDRTAQEIGVLMGGISAERDISIRSGEAIVATLTDRGYDIAWPLFVDRDVDLVLRQARIDVAFLALHGRLGRTVASRACSSWSGPHTGSKVLAWAPPWTRSRPRSVPPQQRADAARLHGERQRRGPLECTGPSASRHRQAGRRRLVAGCQMHATSWSWRPPSRRRCASTTTFSWSASSRATTSGRHPRRPPRGAVEIVP